MADYLFEDKGSTLKENEEDYLDIYNNESDTFFGK